MPSKKQQLQQLLTPPPSAPIDEQRAAELARALAPISPAYLRRLLRASGLPLSPTVEGVLQDNLPNLARTLSALAAAYPQQPQQTRTLVFEAKAHAKLALRRNPNSAERQQKMDWIIRWLENPTIFPLWVQLQQRATETPPAPP
ncbi:MAG: hypothetical protein ACK58M_05150 [Acidobacteriota bacterium]|nr:hypothetical protein [Bryobacteraceae bacterium CoA2 C42]MCA2966107.1 hypothetical protein [Acidobacteriaceae bacterium]